MNISDRGLTFIKDFEQLRLEAYKPTPDDKWTIGYGSTRGVYQGMKITPFEAEQMLSDDIVPVSICIQRTIFIPLEQYQADALYSLIFNVGVKSFTDSTARHCLNLRDYPGFSDQAFSREHGWVRQKGQILAGLVLRREMERRMFFNADYGISTYA